MLVDGLHLSAENFLVYGRHVELLVSELLVLGRLIDDQEAFELLLLESVEA